MAPCLSDQQCTRASRLQGEKAIRGLMQACQPWGTMANETRDSLFPTDVSLDGILAISATGHVPVSLVPPTDVC